MNWAAVVVAAGRGVRFGRPKQLLEIAGLPMAGWSMRAFAEMPEIAELVVATEPESIDAMQALVADLAPRFSPNVVPGGATRQESVRAALAAVPAHCDAILIHDGARPFVSRDDVRAAIAAVRNGRAALLATPVIDTIKLVDGASQKVARTLDRSRLWAAQTPQFAMTADLRDAHAAAEREGVEATDDAALLERIGVEVVVVPSSADNFKVTLPHDIARAEALLGRSERRCQPERVEGRMGHGFDAHRLVEGRALILGGVRVPFERGALGHSDGDALAHAVADALLGAAALPDLGSRFPANDARWKNADSLVLLAQCAAALRDAGYAIGNVDATIVLDQPKLGGFVGEMRAKLAAAINVEQSRVNVKAKRSEGMGYTGDGTGVAAYAVALVHPVVDRAG